ncbi:MAG: glycosyltransferase family 4 protein, partial [Acetobacteraceae bacterium]
YVHGEEITTQDAYDQDNSRRRRALGGTSRIVVVSRFTLEAVRRLLGEAADRKISLIANGVDIARFTPRDKRRDLLKLYRLEESFVFVSVCRLLEKKGIDNSIRALARVSRRHPECRYLIVGSGPYRPALEAIARVAEVADRVRFAGQVSEEDLVDCYCLGDVFVMPNRGLPNGDTEGFGLVFLEANACGLPVIAGRDGGSTDAVRHGVNGLVVDGRSVDEIAAAMLALREDAALRERLHRGALEAAATAGWSARAEAFLAVCGG